MIFYLASNKIPDIVFAVHHCARVPHNTNASHKIVVNRIFCYHQGNNDNGLVFNPSKKLVMDCYNDSDFVGLCVHEDPQDLICARNRIGFVVNFAICSLLQM